MWIEELIQVLFSGKILDHEREIVASVLQLRLQLRSFCAWPQLLPLFTLKTLIPSQKSFHQSQIAQLLSQSLDRWHTMITFYQKLTVKDTCRVTVKMAGFKQLKKVWAIASWNRISVMGSNTVILGFSPTLFNRHSCSLFL